MRTKIVHRLSVSIPRPAVPWSIRRMLAVAIGTAAWTFGTRARAAVSANVRRVLAHEGCTSADRIGSTTRRIFHNGADNYLGLLLLSSSKRGEVARQAEARGVEHLEAALALGRGAILFSAHLGPFEYLPGWFAARGHELIVPVESAGDSWQLRMLLRLRRALALTLVPLDNARASRRLFEALRRNQPVFIMADRAIHGRSAVSDFFGAPAWIPRGPVELSLRSGAPLVGASAWRAGSGRIAGEFTPLTLALPEDQRDKPEVLQMELVRQLERMIAAHLHEWLAFSPIWPPAPH